MPIRPENRDRYLKPKAWKALRVTILARAGNVCEWEGCGAVNGQPHPKTGSKVVLTVAHLDHMPENNDPGNLRASCQKCHNSWDAAHRAAGRKARALVQQRRPTDPDLSAGRPH